MQVGRLVAAAVVLGAALVGCGTGPSQIGSAVILGDDVIPLNLVQDQITFALGPDRAQALAARNQGFGGGYGSEQVAREIVTGAVLSDLVRRRGAEEGIVISDAALDAAIQDAGGEDLFASSILPRDVQRERLRDDLVAAELGRRYVDRMQVTVTIVGFPTEEEAEAAAAVLAAGGPQADAVIAATPAENRAQTLRAADNPSLASSFAFGSPSGSAVVLTPQQDGAMWTVVHVGDLRTDAPVEGPSAVDRFGTQDLQLVGYRLLQPDADALGVRVNPRFGEWDDIALGVVDADEHPGVVVPPTGGAG